MPRSLRILFRLPHLAVIVILSVLTVPQLGAGAPSLPGKEQKAKAEEWFRGVFHPTKKGLVGSAPVDKTKAIKLSPMLDKQDKEYINRALMFVEDEAHSDRPKILLVVIHGTWAADSPEFDDIDNPAYQGIQYLAHNMAAAEKRPVLVLSFAWSGEDDKLRRDGAGTALRNILNASVFTDTNEFSSVVVVAHSHGGNVAHKASKGLFRPINRLYNIGVPTLLDPDYLQANIEESYNLYSSVDPVQWAGSFDQEQLSRSMRKQFDARRQPYQLKKDRAARGLKQITVYNIAVKVNAREPGHVIIKDIIPGLLSMTNAVKAHYRVHRDLIANFDLRAWNKKRHANVDIPVRVAINEYPNTLELVEREPDLGVSGSEMYATIRKEMVFSRTEEAAFAQAFQNRGGLRDQAGIRRKVRQNMADLGRLMYTLIAYMKWRTVGG